MNERPLLLHSLHEFWSLIAPCLDAVTPASIVEIGSEAGTFTEDLLGWAQEHGASVAAVEPWPQPIHRRLVQERALRLIEGKSPEILKDIGAFDVYVIDGDHNHCVVRAELEHVFSQEQGSPLAIMHDVAWPAARRDQYYEPQSIPAAHRQPFSYDGGALPGEPDLAPHRGFRGLGAFAYALHEGGEANGVLTAAEEVLAGRPELELLRVPCIFGLGFVFARDAPFAAEIRRIVGPFHQSDLLARLEENRIDLFLHYIDPRGQAPRESRASPAADLVAGLQREVESLQAEVARLRVDLVERTSPTRADSVA